MVGALLPARPAVMTAMIHGRCSVQELTARARWGRLLLLGAACARRILLPIDRRWTRMVIVRCVVEHYHAYRCAIATTGQLTLIQYLLHRVVVADHIRLVDDQWSP